MQDDDSQYISRLQRAYVRFLSWTQRWRRTAHSTVHDWHHSRLHDLNRRTLMILLVVGICGVVLYVESFYPPRDFPAEQYITIEEGETLTSLSQSLEEIGIVRSAEWLTLLVRIRGGERSVHAGDYFFAKPIGALAVARVITTGAYGLEPVRITIPEGATVAEMALLYEKKLFKFDAKAFVRKATKDEGFLYPDTYYFLPNVKEDEVIRVMKDTFNQRIAEFQEDIAASPLTLEEIVTLASIIEKEAWKPRDQQLISGVLYNRLDRGMLLQVDATFTYTHDKGTYDITRAELADEDNLYNTYVHPGLPPGPIAAVGRSALYAAIHPIESDYLFYLADRNGTTYFSRTYAEHLAKKQRYVD